MKTYTGTQTAWITDRHYLKMVRDGKAGLGTFHLTNPATEMADLGWFKVGTAEVTVKVEDDAEIVKNAVAVLRQAIAKTRAESEANCTLYEGEIQKLLALEGPRDLGRDPGIGLGSETIF